MKHLDLQEIITEHWGINVTLIMLGLSIFSFVLALFGEQKNMIVIVVSLILAFVFAMVAVLLMGKMNRIFKEGVVVKVKVCGISGFISKAKTVEYKFLLDEVEYKDSVGIRNRLNFSELYFVGQEFDAYVLKDKKGRISTALDIFKKLSYYGRG